MAAAPQARAVSVFLTAAQVKHDFGIEYPKDIEVAGIFQVTPENMPIVKRVIEAYLRWQESGARRNQIRAEIDAMDAKALKRDRMHLKRKEMDPTPAKAAQFAVMDAKFAAEEEATKAVDAAQIFVSSIHQETGISCPTIFPSPYFSKQGRVSMGLASATQIIEEENTKLIFAHEAQDLFGIPFQKDLTVCGITLLTPANTGMIKEVVEAYVTARKAEKAHAELKEKLKNFDSMNHSLHEVQKMHWAPEELQILADRHDLNERLTRAGQERDKEIKFRDDLCKAYGITLKNF